MVSSARIERLSVGLAVVLLTATACTRVRGSSVSTAGQAPHQGAVRVLALSIPDGSREVGLIEATGTGELQELVDELRKQAAKAGGDIAKIDRIRTKFEMQSGTRTESYSCGSPKFPQTCSRTVPYTYEVATTTIHGRAFQRK